MMIEPALREAKDEDAPILVALLHAAFEEYRNVLNPPSGAHRESVASVHEKMKTAQWVLSYLNEQPVGCVLYEPHDDYMYLGRLAVLPNFRGRGIADALMNYVETRASVAGLKRVQLGVRVALPAMRAAYERRGYRFLRAVTHEGFAEPTYVILEKVLQ